MLYLQRASAGSGKTYTLAKTYIKLILGIKKEDGSYRLRESYEMKDIHSHILAITFTNKATDEMKSRFVERLADLAADDSNEKTDYMADLVNDFKTTIPQIRQRAREALSEILNNYTNFQVSTIDSFFQTILRTFTYEADLHDNYQVELDDDYITTMGVDSTLSKVRDNEPNNNVKSLVGYLMNRNADRGKRWNMLLKDEVSYKVLLDFVKQATCEDFKKHKDKLDDYFDNIHNYLAKIKAIEANYDSDISALCSNNKEIAKKLLEKFGEDITKNFEKQLKKASDDALCRKLYASALTEYKFEGAKSFPVGKDNLQYYNNEDTCNLLNSFYDNCQACLGLIIEKKIFVDSLPYMGLLYEVLKQISIFRNSNNIVQLSDTNMILRSIINQDDTPFIYERTGCYLHNYLIDEFQDTSAMQWGNLSPLLSESLSRDNDNLIIGDAKQSIYRFRNADYTLITNTVPKTFTHIAQGDSLKENTNWRSSKRVIDFNNSLFVYLANELMSKDRKAYIDFSDIYSGVVQLCGRFKKDKKELGYVEVKKFESSKEDPNPGIDVVGEKIASLIKRGYQQKEIAVLVRTNDEGSAVIDALLKYNESIKDKPDEVEIQFISEESLKINRSKAVNIVISTLDSISRGAFSDKDIQSEKSDKASQRKNVNDLVSYFNHYRAKYPETDAVEVFDKFFANENEAISVSELLKKMPAISLPALTDHIINEFVPEYLLKNEAPYIAAFQDKVLEYCSLYSPDIFSFVKWWAENSSRFSISSPEGVDAVNIMTIHKSKGLEFRCVILPAFDLKTSSLDSETLWVEPYNEKYKSILPPILPIKPTKDLLNTSYKNDYNLLLEKLRFDELNTAYVAFTRAADELYVMLPSPNKNLNKHLIAFLENPLIAVDMLSGALDEDEKKNCLVKSLMKQSDDLYAYGSPLTSEEIREYRKDEASQTSSRESGEITSYYINTESQNLKCKEENDMLADEEDRDPRSFGNVMHKVMSEISNTDSADDDMKHSLLKLVTNGTITESIGVEVYNKIKKALTNQEARQWFLPGLKVMNERQLLKHGMQDRRADRIVVNENGDAVVIDYKFGDVIVAKYHKQVKEYMWRLRESGLYRSVRGYLWYINEDTIEEVKI
jgi:ATP-dependent exoDNAse (exonuclease V) beta subunit